VKKTPNYSECYSGRVHSQLYYHHKMFVPPLCEKNS